MASLNKVILIGHMTADPELKKTPNGAFVCTFSIGVNRRYTKEGGTPQTDFISIVAWRTTAEFVSKYFRKGQAICVCGQIQVRSWEAQDGGKRYATEVIADEVSFVERRRDDGEGASPVTAPSFEELEPDDDFPF